MDIQQANLTISAAILSKNAENHIEPCLRSIAWVDEIVLVDGHSTDRTCEIAERYGARVVLHDFVSFPAERAFALEQTTHDWVLSVVYGHDCSPRPGGRNSGYHAKRA